MPVGNVTTATIGNLNDATTPVFLILAASVLLAWDPNPEADNVALYKVYVGIQSMAAGNPSLIGYPVSTPETEYLVEGLSYGTKYFFVATAINFEGLESGYLNEVVYTPWPVPTPTPTPTIATDTDTEASWQPQGMVAAVVRELRYISRLLVVFIF